MRFRKRRFRGYGKKRYGFKSSKRRFPARRLKRYGSSRGGIRM